MKKLTAAIPMALTVLATLVFGVLAGAVSYDQDFFISEALISAKKTVHTYMKSRQRPKVVVVGFGDGSLSTIASDRFDFTTGEGMTDNVIWAGGADRFLDYCPHDGCLAVEFSNSGELVRAVPWRVTDYMKIPPLEDFPYEHAVGVFG